MTATDPHTARAARASIPLRACMSANAESGIDFDRHRIRARLLREQALDTLWRALLRRAGAQARPDVGSQCAPFSCCQ